MTDDVCNFVVSVRALFIKDAAKLDTKWLSLEKKIILWSWGYLFLSLPSWLSQFYFSLNQNNPSFLNHAASIQLLGEIWRFRIRCRWKDQFVHFKVLPDTALPNVTSWGITSYTLPPIKWERGWLKVEKTIIGRGDSWGKKG